MWLAQTWIKNFWEPCIDTSLGLSSLTHSGSMRKRGRRTVLHLDREKEVSSSQAGGQTMDSDESAGGSWAKW